MAIPLAHFHFLFTHFLRDPANYTCQCIAGYRGDGYVCIEEQNCLNNPTLCDMNAKCHSTNSGLVCVCNPGEFGSFSLNYRFSCVAAFDPPGTVCTS